MPLDTEYMGRCQSLVGYVFPPVKIVKYVTGGGGGEGGGGEGGVGGEGGGLGGDGIYFFILCQFKDLKIPRFALK